MAHGTHASGGTEYTTNVTTVGTPGTSGAYTKEGALLTKAQLAFFANQNLDIA